MATCPQCKGHLTEGHRCPRRRIYVVAEIVACAHRRAVWRACCFWRRSILAARRPTWTPPRSSAASSSPSASIVSSAADCRSSNIRQCSCSATPRELQKGVPDVGIANSLGRNYRRSVDGRIDRASPRAHCRRRSAVAPPPLAQLSASRLPRRRRPHAIRSHREGLVQPARSDSGGCVARRCGAQETSELLSTCPATAHIPIVRLTPGRRLPPASSSTVSALTVHRATRRRRRCGRVSDAR